MFLPEEIEAFWLSLEVSLISVLLIALPAIFLGYLMANYSFYGKALLDLICKLPLVLPPVVVGYLLLLLLGREGLFGSYLYEYFGIHLSLQRGGAIIACAIISFPLFLQVAQTAFEANDPKIKEAALSLGAGPLGLCFTIILPQALPGLLAAFVLAWGRALGEFGATITFAANIAGQTRTLPLAIYTQMQNPTLEAEASAYRLVLLSILLSILCLGLSMELQKKIRRKRGEAVNGGGL